jgi:hypothetical protein
MEKPDMRFAEQFRDLWLTHNQGTCPAEVMCKSISDIREAFVEAQNTLRGRRCLRRLGLLQEAYERNENPKRIQHIYTMIARFWDDNPVRDFVTPWKLNCMLRKLFPPTIVGCPGRGSFAQTRNDTDYSAQRRQTLDYMERVIELSVELEPQHFESVIDGLNDLAFGGRSGRMMLM